MLHRAQAKSESASTTGRGVEKSCSKRCHVRPSALSDEARGKGIAVANRRGQEQPKHILHSSLSPLTSLARVACALRGGAVARGCAEASMGDWMFGCAFVRPPPLLPSAGVVCVAALLYPSMAKFCDC